jgi:hypothetical protein
VYTEWKPLARPGRLLLRYVFWCFRVGVMCGVALMVPKHVQGLGAAAWPVASVVAGAGVALLCRGELPVVAAAFGGFFLLMERTGLDVDDWFPLWSFVAQGGAMQAVLTFTLSPLVAGVVVAAWPTRPRTADHSPEEGEP